MTQLVDAAMSVSVTERRHGAPWPLVERRGQPRPGAAPVASSAGAQVPLERRARTGRPARASTWRRHYGHALLIVDVIAALLGVGAALLSGALPGGPQAVLFVVLLPVAWLGLLEAARAYEARFLGSGAQEQRRVVDAGAVAAVAIVLIPILGGAAQVSAGSVVAVLVSVAVSLLGRVAGRQAVVVARAHGRCRSRVLLVGPAQSVQELSVLLTAHPENGVVVVGCCLPSTSGAGAALAGIPVLGDLDEVAPIVWRGGVDMVTVASAPETGGPALRKLAWTLEGAGAELVVAPGVVELGGPRLHVRRLTGLPLLHVSEAEVHGVRRLIKTVLERILAATLLLLLTPVLVLTALAVRLTSRGPALFRQTRIGWNAEPFVLLKFRTMYVDAERRRADLVARNKHAEGPLFKMDRDPRVTRVGKVLRRLSLDELPQLVHVVTGRMSLVGPRPALPDEVATHDDTVRRRSLVRPGLTGLWQVSGRSDLSWDESVLLDLRYVENWSLGLDARILCRTVTAVLRGRGAY